ncbi:hypothetical protein L596_027785 [Steinernema carpocapsae]|uniref:Phosphatidic acid phosphatase type 2/haloperoxidase domain-containing protein n=1 Tax=Steinernema carpocapsae TaxID=34508 RepID=A0A4V5ZXP5_STECR|nr:hypothetical protein L596_027785 [Steinernema carpocapsae]
MPPASIQFPLIRWIIAFIGLGFSMLASYLIPKATGPVQRGFFCDDESIRYPYKENTVDPVLPRMRLLLRLHRHGASSTRRRRDSRLFLSMTIDWTPEIIATELIYNRLCLYAGAYSPGQIPNYKIGSLKIPYVIVRMFFAFAVAQIGLGTGIVIMNMTKYTVGRLRPHFIDLCKPNVTLANCSSTHQYIENYVCESGADAKLIVDAHLSFFSGHTSNAFFFALYIVLYLHLRLGKQFFDVIVFPLYYMVLIGAAAFVGYSRIFDYKHHWSDVLCGAIFGCFMAVLTVVYFRKLLVLPPIRPELRSRVQFVNENEGSARVVDEAPQTLGLTEQV